MYIYSAFHYNKTVIQNCTQHISLCKIIRNATTRTRHTADNDAKYHIIMLCLWSWWIVVCCFTSLPLHPNVFGDSARTRHYAIYYNPIRLVFLAGVRCLCSLYKKIHTIVAQHQNCIHTHTLLQCSMRSVDINVIIKTCFRIKAR